MTDNQSAGGVDTSAGLRPTEPDLYTIVATAQATRWGYTDNLDPDALAIWISGQAGSPNLRGDVDAVLSHRPPLLTDQHGDFVLDVFDDLPATTHDYRVVLRRGDTVIREFPYPAYRIYTLFAHWKEADEVQPAPPQPTVTVLCGSTRFSHTLREQNLRLTLAGHIVLTIGCDMRTDTDLFSGLTEEQIAAIKTSLDALHLQKIDLAHDRRGEVLVLNVGGYVGDSTRREIAYAESLGVPIRYLEPAEEA